MSDGSVSIEHDHFPQVANNAMRRVEAIGLKDKLADSQSRRELLGNATNEEYKKILGYINSITRGMPIEYDYKNGGLPLEETPPLEEKERLMNLTFETVRSIVNNDHIDNSTSLRLAGLTLAGAINYIHPYENGNGRSGRVAHYLIEFGTQRGEEAFNEELYAIIAKIPMYTSDNARALYDTPPPELSDAIRKKINSTHGYKGSFAEQRVEFFLKMMQGSIDIPITDGIVLRNLVSGGKESVPPNTLDGRTLYVKDYLNRSSIPYRKPSEFPPGAIRVIAQQRDKPTSVIYFPVDLVS